MKINSYTSVQFEGTKPVSATWHLGDIPGEWPTNEEMQDTVEQALKCQGYNVVVGKVNHDEEEFSDCYASIIPTPLTVDGVEVKKDQVWQTNAGNLVFIIEQENGQLGFLWYDHIANDMNCASIMNRLALHCPEYDFSRWAMEVQNYQPVIVRRQEV